MPQTKSPKRTYPYYVVNVFGHGLPFSGNPLAVVANGDDLSDDEMLNIARQFNLSETVFVLPSNKAVADLRIFSPMGQMSFAGHPTLGSAFVLHHLGLVQDLPNDFSLQTLSGTVPISVRNGRYDFSIDKGTIKPMLYDDFASTLSLNPHQIVRADVANCGIAQLIIQVKDRTTLDDMRVHLDKLQALSTKYTTPDVFVYAWCVDEHEIYARAFFEQDSMMVQDAGTGSACANVGLILQSLGKHGDYTIHQGDDMGKPCHLYLSVGRAIKVGGYVHLMAKGELYV